MATTSGVYPVYENQFNIKVGETYVDIAEMETFSVSFDNGVQEWTPFESEGWVRRLLTAKGITISVSGKRNLGDAGNNHVAGLAWKNGRESEADVKWNFPDGTVVEFTGSVINVTNIGAGDSTNVAPLEFEILSNGKPTVTFPEGD
jgi:hypothetical protein